MEVYENPWKINEKLWKINEHQWKINEHRKKINEIRWERNENQKKNNAHLCGIHEFLEKFDEHPLQIIENLLNPCSSQLKSVVSFVNQWFDLVVEGFCIIKH